MMNIIIFSKDRACQLDLLLRSIIKMWPSYCNEMHNMNIIWTATRLNYFGAYMKLIEKYKKEFNFIRQGQYCITAKAMNDNIPYTMFIVDDLVFKEPFSIDCEEYKKFKGNDDIMALSLRLDIDKNYCYTQNKNMMVPIFRMKNMWEWEGKDFDWGYPWSIDASIFRTKDIMVIANNYIYPKNPNLLETCLIKKMIRRPYMMCFDKAKVINNPANKVGKFHNRYGKIDIEKLNDIFLSGKQIALEPIIGMESNSCHKEFEYTYEDATN